MRAARAYSRKTLVELADEIRVDRKRLQAIELGRRRLRLGEQDAIAFSVVAACALPEGWIQWAFTEGGSELLVLDELGALTDRVDDLAGLLEHGLGLRPAPEDPPIDGELAEEILRGRRGRP